MSSGDETVPASDDDTDHVGARPSRALEIATAPGGTMGRFAIRGVLGAGGMGVVLEALDPDLDRKVAIKVLHSGAAGTRARSHLQREAQAMAKVSHPNAVTVYEVGRAGDHLFIAMELVEGTTLRAWLAADQRSWRDVVHMFVGAGRGLAAVHASGLVHRDFKPENVLLGKDGRPRVSDFGIADAGANEDARVVGTPAYMSPEQWLGAELDVRSDQFSYCVTFWQALYGASPFDGDTPQELRAAVLAGRRRTIAGTDRGVPRWLGAILDRGLATNPAERWPSMAALLDEIDRREKRRRNAWLAAGGVALVVASSGGAIASMALTGNGTSTPPTPAPGHDEPPAPPGLPDLAAVRPLTQLGREACAYSPTIDRGGSVVFDRTEGDAVDLYRVPLAGGTPARLTSAAATWEWRANAGRRAGEVIHLVEDPKRRVNSSLAWLDLATGTETLASAVYAHDAVAVGDAIFYTPFEGLEVRRITAAGDQPFAQAPRGPVFIQLAASPRGDRLAAVGGRSGKLCIIDTVTAAVDCTIEGVLAVRPAFGADGTAIYYGAIDGIHRRDLATRADALIVPDARTPGGLAIAPDGSALVYSECGATSPILDMSVAPPQVVIADPSANDVAVGAHGEIAWTHLERGVRVLMMRTAAGESIQGTRPDLGAVESPAFSPDGKQIAFRVIGPTAGIHLVGPKGSTWPERLTDGARDYNPTWVDDARIAFVRLDEQQRPSIYVVDADGGTPRRVAATSRMLQGNRGTDLLVSGMKRMFWLDVDTGKERPGPDRPDPDVSLASTSPDGTWALYQTGPGANDLWRISTAPGATLEHLASIPAGQTMTQAAITNAGTVLAAPGTWSGDLVLVPARAGSRF